METIRAVVTDDSELRETVEEIERLSNLDVRLHRDIELGGFNGFFDFPLNFFEVERDSALGTGHFAVRIKRTKRLNDLLAALRTGHIDHARSLAQFGTAGI